MKLPISFRKNLDNRVHFLDEVRGALIILVVLYHALYLYYNVSPLGGFAPDWADPLFNPWLQAAIYVGAGALILLSGISTQFSQNNFNRGLTVFLIAGAITVGSLFVFDGNQQILWGILHCIGFSIILYDLLRKPLAKCKAVWAIPVLAVLFVLTFNLQDVYDSRFGIPFVYEMRPHILVDWLFPVGLPHNGFYSADYYPLMPWLFLFLIGTFVGRYFASDRCPKWMKTVHIRPLAFVGRHTLWVYLGSIPVIYGIYWLIALCMGVL